MFQDIEVSKGAWFVFIILSAVPFVNIIFWIVLLLGTETNRSLKNYVVVNLIVGAVAVVLYFLVFAAMFASMAGSM